MLDKETKIIPCLRINNRSANQNFLEQKLGLKTVLEEGADVELTGHSVNNDTKLVLIESPSVRTRAVQGLKKLAKITLKVQNPDEIEGLLAAGAPFEKLYRGAKGFAFETRLPEGYLFLLHSEDSIADLQEILPPVAFKEQEDFVGLTDFSVNQVLINTPTPEASQTFYENVLPNQTMLAFQEAQGDDLLAVADSTWDLDSLRIAVMADADWADLEEKLAGNYFKDKKERFLQTTDPSKIELWFEK